MKTSGEGRLMLSNNLTEVGGVLQKGKRQACLTTKTIQASSLLWVVVVLSAWYRTSIVDDVETSFSNK